MVAIHSATPIEGPSLAVIRPAISAMIPAERKPTLQRII